MANYNIRDYYRAFDAYRASNGCVTTAASVAGVSRPTIYRWKEKGFPIAMTGGVEWDAFILQEGQESLLLARAGGLDDREFQDELALDVQRVIKRVVTRLLAEEGELRASDVKTLHDVWLRIQGQELAMIDFEREVMLRLARIIRDEVKDDAYKRIVHRLMDMERQDRKALKVRGNVEPFMLAEPLDTQEPVPGEWK